MTVLTPTRRRGAAALVVVLVALLLQLPATRSDAAAELTVGDAVAVQDGSTQSVTGYVVGQPTSTTTVVRTGFPTDYAMAIADAPGETDVDAMLYVQVPAASRAAWGLRSNPGLLDQPVTVTGVLAAYFSHPGMTGTSSFTPGGGADPDPDPDPTPDPGDYYAGTEGLAGDALKTELHQIISSGTTALSYSQVWEALTVTDEDPDNSANVLLFYSGESHAKSDNGGGVDQWNREHVWAQSHGDFGTGAGPGTDVHHLRPTDVTVNSSRGNLDFDDGGTPVPEAPGNSADSDSWEPDDRVKGDVARALFYMAVRWEGGDGFADLELNDSTSNGSSPYHGRLSVLLQWNTQDPPDAFEQNRNEVVFDQFQGNRNPFIDHPEWAASIFG